jgi:hypothetical protein
LAEGRGSLALKADVLLAGLVLWAHVGVILFNLFGLIAVPLGAWRGWEFVRVFWWRALHLAALAIVALQALLGRACFLTLWQDSLVQNAGESGSQAPLIQRWVSEVIFWPLPVWFFALLYVAVWIYAMVLWRLVPPRRRGKPAA